MNDINYCKVMAYALMCTPFIQLIILFIPIPFLIIIAVIIGGFLPTLMWLKRKESTLVNGIGQQYLNYNLTSLLFLAIELTVLNYSPEGVLYKIVIVLINLYQLIGFFAIWASIDEINQEKVSSIIPRLSLRFIK